MLRLFRFLHGALFILAVLVPIARLPAQEKEPVTQRLRGIIDESQEWSGHVIITDDVTIQSGKVIVAAGTVVEFAQKEAGHNPCLTVGAADRTGGELELLGTAEKPVVFRTMPDTNPGHLVVNVYSRLIPAEKPDRSTSQPAVLSRLPNDISWQHVRLENLGYIATKHEGKQDVRLPEPALAFYVLGDAHTVSLADCSFLGCTRLVARAASGARITVAGNRFDQPRDRAAIEVFGREGESSAGPVVISRNTAAAAITVHGAGATIMENILVGPDAAVVVDQDNSESAKITTNYIHNTTEEDDGRYGLNCENPAALIENNIVRGGSSCVWSGSRRMSGNVLIAAPKLSSKVVRVARTHQLVQALPAGAVFERNLLIGPAYSLLMPQPMLPQGSGSDSTETIVVRNNVFDGQSESHRAVQLNSIGRPSTPVAVFNNVFLRVPTLVYSDSKGQTNLVYADHNAVAPSAERAFDQIEVAGVKKGAPGRGAKDVQAADIAALRLSGPPTAPLPDFMQETWRFLGFEIPCRTVCASPYSISTAR